MPYDDLSRNNFPVLVIPAGENAVIEFVPGLQIAPEQFDDLTSCSREGNDLLMHFGQDPADDTVRIVNLFSPERIETDHIDFAVILPDGVAVDIISLARACDPFDMSGPCPVCRQLEMIQHSSGLNAYRDDAEDLLPGVTALGVANGHAPNAPALHGLDMDFSARQLAALLAGALPQAGLALNMPPPLDTASMPPMPDMDAHHEARADTADPFQHMLAALRCEQA